MLIELATCIRRSRDLISLYGQVVKMGYKKSTLELGKRTTSFNLLCTRKQKQQWFENKLLKKSFEKMLYQLTKQSFKKLILK